MLSTRRDIGVDVEVGSRGGPFSFFSLCFKPLMLLQYISGISLGDMTLLIDVPLLGGGGSGVAA